MKKTQGSNLSRKLRASLIRYAEKNMDSRSPLGPGPFYERDRMPVLRTLEDNWQVIRGELDRVLEHRGDLPNFQDLSSVQRKLTSDDGWKTFFFHAYGVDFDGNRRQCPETAALLRAIPGLKTAFFSILGPGKHLPEHRGPYKGVVRYHLALKIPEPRTACGITVGGVTEHWREGCGLLFDDSHPHEAWNDTGEDRVVLFLDIVRPLPFPHSWLNELIIGAVARSPYVQELRHNQDAWERWFEDLREGTSRTP